MFADRYFQKYGRYTPLIEEDMVIETSMFVMIPCFMEPSVLDTLESLAGCHAPSAVTEVLVVINESENCDPETSAFNHKSWMEIREWIKGHRGGRLRFFVTPPLKLASKWAGVGMARKRGMDEGLWRFDQTGKPGGIIISLDADTIVDPNYLVAIEDHFRKNPDHVGATIAFSHQLDGLSLKQKEGIILYEKYLRYYKTALAYTGFPHALFTVGSAFSVTAEAYMKRGGMTRRKAGEDFYFLQTLTQLGRVGEIEVTEVHPSARISDRVPFGTGIAIKHWMNGTTDLNYTYNIQAFLDLKQLFARLNELYTIDFEKYNTLVSSLPVPVASFLEEDDFFHKVTDLSANCSNIQTFKERFFHVFNAFKILKLMNFTHHEFYTRRRLDEVWSEINELIRKTPVSTQSSRD
jgi:hypothetical protein